MKPEEIKKAREQFEEAERELELDDLRNIMGTVQGRRFIWRFLAKGNIFRKTFTGNSSSFYLDGQRELALEFYQDIMVACPEKFWLAQEENFKHEDFKRKELKNG